jgi:hypothetical protein
MPPRKLALCVILAGSVLFFFLMLFAGAIAIMREGAAPGHGVGLVSAALSVKRIVVRHLFHHHR